MEVIQQLAQPVQREFEQCKTEFDSLMHHSSALLNEVLDLIAQRKGKMMRPLLTLLSAKLFGPVTDESVQTALAFEFFHTASLIHDDIVDESNERRGLPSVNCAYSDSVAVLVGDYMLANALKVAARTGRVELIRTISQTAQDLVDGELLQLRNVLNQTISEDAYYHIIHAKTASLFAACAESGARTTGASDKQLEAMYSFGEYVGKAFQIKDDIFDFVAGSEIGKPTGIDMAEGKLTLPVIHALFATEDQKMFELAYKVKDGSVSADEIKQLVQFSIDNGGIDYAVEVMERYAKYAKQQLDSAPDSDAKQSLMKYVDFVLERNW